MVRAAATKATEIVLIKKNISDFAILSIIRIIEVAPEGLVNYKLSLFLVRVR